MPTIYREWATPSLGEYTTFLQLFLKKNDAPSTELLGLRVIQNIFENRSGFLNLPNLYIKSRPVHFYSAIVDHMLQTTNPSNLWVRYTNLAFVKFDRNFKANIYSFINASRFSRFKRRKYIRRRHLYSWTQYFNILSVWASTYRFYKKIYATTLGSTLLRTRLLGFNSLSLFPKNYAAEESLRDFTNNPMPSSLTSFQHSRFTNRLTLPFANPNLILAPSIHPFRTLWPHTKTTPFFYWYENRLLASCPEATQRASTPLPLIFALWLSLVKTLYTLFILLLRGPLLLD